MTLAQAIRRLEARADAAIERLVEETRGRFDYTAYRKRPVALVREVLKANPEPYQVEILEACVESPRAAWRAAHGVGKTTLLSWILIWWLLTRPFSRVLVLAPAFERQVGRYLLPEVAKWLRNAREELPLTVRANSVEVDGYEREWFAIGIQASDPGKVEGGHAESLCILADEAKALDSEVIAALHGTQTDVGGDRLYFLASTPGGPSGPFYDIFRKGSRLWRTFHTSGVDSALVSDTWVEERAEEWGRASPLFISRVLGQFPEEDEGTLLKLSDLEAAVERAEPALEDGVALGVDVARFGGDASAVCTWRGKCLVGVELKRGLDTMAVASWVASVMNRTGARAVGVDEIGIGSGAVDRLKQLGHAVTAINVGASARRSELFLNFRAEIAWSFREALERGEISLPNDESLISELASLRYEYNARGKIKLEPKAETKKRVGRSPDSADAALLGWAVAHGPARPRPRRLDASMSYVSVGDEMIPMTDPRLSGRRLDLGWF